MSHKAARPYLRRLWRSPSVVTVSLTRAAGKESRPPAMRTLNRILRADEATQEASASKAAHS